MMMLIDDSCKSAVITLRDPAAVYKKQKDLYREVSEASVDAKLPKIQQIIMGPSETIIKYTNQIDGLINDLSAACHLVSDLERERALFKGLDSNFATTAQVISSTNRNFENAMVQLVIQEYSLQ